MNLYLLRHGEAGTRLAVDSRDRERTLTAAGKTEIEKIGKSLGEAELEFDVVASSPLKRAMETAVIVNKQLGRRAKVEEWPELSPEGDREALYRRIARIKPDGSVLCVGHEPYLTSAIAELIGGGEGIAGGLRIVLKKGGLAKITLTGASPRANGELRWLLTPKQIRKMS